MPPRRTILNSLLLPWLLSPAGCWIWWSFPLANLGSDIGRISSAISFPASIPCLNFNPVSTFLSLGLNVFQVNFLYPPFLSLFICFGSAQIWDFGNGVHNMLPVFKHLASTFFLPVIPGPGVSWLICSQLLGAGVACFSPICWPIGLEYAYTAPYPTRVLHLVAE